MKRFEKKSEPQRDNCCSQAMADLATESWRLEQAVQRAVFQMDPMEANRFLNQFEWYRRVLRTALAEVGLRVVDVTGEPYQVGMAVTPLNLEDFPDDPEIRFRIAQMVEPIVMEHGKVRKTGTAMLAEDLEEA